MLINVLFCNLDEVNVQNRLQINQLLQSYRNIYTSIYSEERLQQITKFVQNLGKVSESRKQRHQLLSERYVPLASKLNEQFILLQCTSKQKAVVDVGGSNWPCV